MEDLRKYTRRTELYKLSAEEQFISFFLSVLASVIAYYVCKWLDTKK